MTQVVKNMQALKQLSWIGWINFIFIETKIPYKSQNTSNIYSKHHQLNNLNQNDLRDAPSFHNNLHKKDTTSRFRVAALRVNY